MEKNKKNKLKPFHNLNLPKYFWTITFDLFKILLSYNFMICYNFMQDTKSCCSYYCIIITSIYINK